MEKTEKIGFGDLCLLQDDDGFKFGIDAVILSDFVASFCPNAKTIVDLGTGNGVIPLILSHKIKDCKITGLDIQQKSIELARRSVEKNRLENIIDFRCGDVSDVNICCKDLKAKTDVVVSNPPYVAMGSGIVNENSSKFIACQETTAGIEEFISAASYLLSNKGHFFLVFRPSRLVDVFFYCRKHGIEPKDIRFVAPSEGNIPNIVLVHCILGGGYELKFLDTLYVYDSNGEYSSEILEIYEKTG